MTATATPPPVSELFKDGLQSALNGAADAFRAAETEKHEPAMTLLSQAAAVFKSLRDQTPLPYVLPWVFHVTTREQSVPGGTGRTMKTREVCRAFCETREEAEGLAARDTQACLNDPERKVDVRAANEEDIALQQLSVLAANIGTFITAGMESLQLHPLSAKVITETLIDQVNEIVFPYFEGDSPSAQGWVGKDARP